MFNKETDGNQATEKDKGQRNQNHYTEKNKYVNWNKTLLCYPNLLSLYHESKNFILSHMVDNCSCLLFLQILDKFIHYIRLEQRY